MTNSRYGQGSNPPRITFEPLRFLQRQPGMVVGSGLALIVIAFLAIRAHWAVIFAAILPPLYVWRSLAYFRLAYMDGDANPSAVISLNPLLVAVYLDLTKGQGHFPAIYIMRGGPACDAGQGPVLGMRVATTTSYGQHEADLPYFEYVETVYLDDGCSNPAELIRVIKSIPAQQWQALQHGVASLPAPLKPGLHPLRHLGNWAYAPKSDMM